MPFTMVPTVRGLDPFAGAVRLALLVLALLVLALAALGVTGCGACDGDSPRDASRSPGIGTAAPAGPGRPAQWPPPPDDSDLPGVAERSGARSDPRAAATGPRPGGGQARPEGTPMARAAAPGRETRLWSQLTDPDPEVREHVLERLWGRRDPQSLELLEEYLAREPDPDLKARALELLEEAGPRAASALARGLSDPSPAVRERAVEALETVGGAESVALLWAAHAREGDPDVAETILDALEILGEDVEAFREP